MSLKNVCVVCALIATLMSACSNSSGPRAAAGGYASGATITRDPDGVWWLHAVPPRFEGILAWGFGDIEPAPFDPYPDRRQFRYTGDCERAADETGCFRFDGGGEFDTLAGYYSGQVYLDVHFTEATDGSFAVTDGYLYVDDYQIAALSNEMPDRFEPDAPRDDLGGVTLRSEGVMDALEFPYEYCDEGETQSCPCADGSSGTQSCNLATGLFGACSCGGSGEVGPLCQHLLTQVVAGINAELDARRASEGSIVPPRIDLSSCPSEIPPFDSFIGRYCDAGLEFTGQLDAQIAAALGVCWAQQCGHGTGADDAEAYAADAIANYRALYDGENCSATTRCMFYGVTPGCGTCANSTACPNVTFGLADIVEP